jgi:hypothetical protein
VVVATFVAAGFGGGAPAALAGGAHGTLAYTGSLSERVAYSDGPEAHSETTISLSWSATAQNVHTGGQPVDWSFSSLEGSISYSGRNPVEAESCDATLSKGSTPYSPSYYQQLESEPTVTVKTNSPGVLINVISSSEEGKQECSASAVVNTLLNFANYLASAKQTADFDQYESALGIEGKVPAQGTHQIPGNAKVSFTQEQSGDVEELSATISSGVTVSSTDSTCTKNTVRASSAAKSHGKKRSKAKECGPTSTNPTKPKAAPTKPVRTPAKTKQDLNDGNTVFAVAGVGVGLLSLVPALAPITVPLRIVAAGLGLCGIGLKVVAERDPPDPDYRQIAKPVPTPIPAELSPSSSTQVSEALQALSGNLSRSIALSRTLVTTLNREHTAARAGAVAPERQQMAAAAGYAEQLAGSLTEYAGVARAAASALLAAKLPDPSIQSLKRYRSKLKSATMIGALVKLGASPSEARATANRMYAEASSARGPVLEALDGPAIVHRSASAAAGLRTYAGLLSAAARG